MDKNNKMLQTYSEKIEELPYTVYWQATKISELISVLNEFARDSNDSRKYVRKILKKILFGKRKIDKAKLVNKIQKVKDLNSSEFIKISSESKKLLRQEYCQHLIILELVAFLKEFVDRSNENQERLREIWRRYLLEKAKKNHKYYSSREKRLKALGAPSVVVEAETKEVVIEKNNIKTFSDNKTFATYFNNYLNGEKRDFFRKDSEHRRQLIIWNRR